MRLLFTKSNLIGSRLICWFTSEPVSHCAVEIGMFTFHASLLGPAIWSTVRFRDTHQIIYEVEYPESPGVLGHLLSLDGKPYDYMAVLWMALSFLCRKLTGHLLPGPNKWASKKALDCTEELSYAIFGQQDSVITPYQLYLKVRDNAPH